MCHKTHFQGFFRFAFNQTPFGERVLRNAITFDDGPHPINTFQTPSGEIVLRNQSTQDSQNVRVFVSNPFRGDSVTSLL